MKAQIRPQLGQALNLTPQLLQSIRLLQLTAVQLEMEVLSALELNPMLERDEPEDSTDPDADEAPPRDTDQAALETADWDSLRDPSFLSGSNGAGTALDDPTALLSARGSSDPRVRLLELLALQWESQDLAIAAWCLDHCDDRGYLEIPLAGLIAAGSRALRVTAADVAQVRHRLLHGEWPGMTAVDLAESLAAQLAAGPDTPQRELARRVLDGHLDLLAARDTGALAKALGETPEAIESALGLIRGLRPSPAEDLPASPEEYIIPDVVTWKTGDQWHVALNNRAIPRVRVSAHCELALGGGKGQADTSALRGLLEEARWLVRGLAMRNDTLLRTARVLVNRQQAFLDHGEEAIVPLTLQEVATEIEMHESTVSRITSGKYIQTPRGPMELKRLFAARLEGAEVSGVAVRAMVKRLIDNELPHAPLGDAAITTMLVRQGVRIARRTVAKYREQLSIPSARARARQPDQSHGHVPR